MSDTPKIVVRCVGKYKKQPRQRRNDGLNKYQRRKLSNPELVKAASKRGEANYKQRAIDSFEEWKELMAKAPQHPLTEEEWNETCRFFGGCAYCEKEEIASRSFLVARKDGGKYCVWNIVPLCERCTQAISYKGFQANPFIRLNSHLCSSNSAAYRFKYTSMARHRLINYLRRKMEVDE